MKSLSKHILREEFDTCGKNLVEASAGTGKTYSIQTIFLRLVVTEGIPVQEILVVTFTDAATKELRERLRSILEKCQLSSPLSTDDPDIKRIAGILKLELHNIPEKYATTDKTEIQKRRIGRALLDFDLAAINTIHGFCQRSLQEFAFECGYDFDTEVVNSDIRLQQLCNDWWRQINYRKPNTISDHIFKTNIPTPEDLLNLVKAIAKRPKATLLPDTDDATSRTETDIKEAIDNAITYLKDNLNDINADIKSNYTKEYFETDIRESIKKNVSILASTDKDNDLIALFTSIKELNTNIHTAKSINPYSPPPEVQLCIDACNAQKTLKGTEKNIAFKEATDTIHTYYDELTRFLKKNMGFYTKNDFTDSEKRKEHLERLKEQNDQKELKKTITKICNLRLRKKVPWSCCCNDTTNTFFEAVKSIIHSEKTVLQNEQVKGAKKVICRYNADKHNAHEMTYDDMLQRLEQALTGKQAATLRTAMQNKYSAALIDEFQDTDPVQYNIFNEIFAKGNLPFFYVGDPKQAIYSFRGGDVFTYSRAANSVDKAKKYSLDTNYRSQSPLIDAINSIFIDRGDEHKSIFGDKIRYSDRLQCNDLPNRLMDNGIMDTKPFKIWEYQATDNRNPSSYSSPEAMIIYADVANEIVRLLNSKKTGFIKHDSETNIPAGEIQNIKPSDIAILVRRHAEAAYIYHALQDRGVPVVRQGGDNVFDSSEALELLYLLKAMVSPENLTAVKTALASKLLPLTDKETISISEGAETSYVATKRLGIEQLPNSLEQWITLFKETKELWLSKDFSSALSRLIRKTGININLASRTTGERRLATIKQLHDLIHQNTTEQHLGPEGVVKWFTKQLDNDTREENDAFDTRLESDADAVQIMTIFKSKGLEFPIVFIPTMWTTKPSGRSNHYLIYHEETEPNQTIIQLNKEDKNGKILADAEKAEEDIRNLYVAATRASYRTYIAAGALGSKNITSSTIAKCMPDNLIEQWQSNPATGIDVITKTLIHVIPKQLTTINKATNSDGMMAKEADVDRSRGHTSFSSISPHGHATVNMTDSRDFDANDIDTYPKTETTELDIFSFPAGAHTGECWHSIFELLDFKTADNNIRERVDTQLTLFHLNTDEEERKKDIIFNMVKNVLQADIKVADNKTLKLSNINEKQKLAELSFDFALHPSDSSNEENAIRNVLNKHWQNDTGENKLFLERLHNWQTTIPSGFMTGFIDLLFEQDGKYYILDWKSNRLNCKPEGFGRDGLASEIANHSYFLQYLIYTVAIHRYLSQCLGDDYNYDTHFGGVLYIFLRGVDQSEDQNNQNGIFYTKPDKALIEELSDALAGPAEGGY